jgi:uncharacterized protein YsxB (DUF464 family)
MTTITIYQDRDGKFRGFSCMGHSGYADAGEDIVCASVSALVITTVNAIEQFTGDGQTESDEDQALIRFRLDENYSHDTDLLIRTMLLGLNEIQESYGSYLQILFEEV